MVGSPRRVLDMATSGAIPVGRHRHIAVCTGLVITSVTTSTIRLVSAGCPGHRLTVGAVTGGAGQIAGMIAGVVRRTVAEDRLRPRVGGVALIALYRSDEVRVWLAGGGRAIVASGTGTGHGIVIETGRHPGHCAVACPAIR